MEELNFLILTLSNDIEGKSKKNIKEGPTNQNRITNYDIVKIKYNKILKLRILTPNMAEYSTIKTPNHDIKKEKFGILTIKKRWNKLRQQQIKLNMKKTKEEEKEIQN